MQQFFFFLIEYSCNTSILKLGKDVLEVLHFTEKLIKDHHPFPNGGTSLPLPCELREEDSLVREDKFKMM